MSKKRVMFIASTGGHLEELLQLKSMFSKYEYSLITEKTKSNMYLKDIYKNRVHYLIYGTKHHFLVYPFKLLINCFISLGYYLRYRPDYIITTGVHTAGPMCCIGRILGSKVVFIESFANRNTKSEAGKLVYYVAHTFVVQWDEMEEIYPKAKNWGWIY